MQLRQLDGRDRERVGKLFVEAFSLPPWNDRWEDPSTLRLYMEELLLPFNALCFGLFDGDGKLVAMALGRTAHFYDGTQYRVDEICVAPERQGQGLGSTLLSLLRKEAIRRGIKSIVLSTHRDFPAYAFYRKNGFEEVENGADLVWKL